MKAATHFTLLVAIFTAARFSTTAQAYGPLGHEIVGAIADARLANTPTAAKIRALLDGLTLEKAALIPDEIKGWDTKGVDDRNSFRYARHRKLISSCAISGGRTRQRTTRGQARLLTIGFTMPTSLLCPRKNTARAEWVAASGTSSI
jgi:hypothetical protein